MSAVKGEKCKIKQYLIKLQRGYYMAFCRINFYEIQARKGGYKCRIRDCLREAAYAAIPYTLMTGG